MPVIGTYIKYRPLRVGFCIKPNDFDSLKRVAIINSYLCGGIFNPIIVIDEQDGEEDVKKKVLAVRPDILCPFHESIAPKIKMFEREYLPNLFEINDNLTYETNGLHEFQILDMDSIMRHIWENHMRMSKRKYSNCLLPTWDKEDDLSLLFNLLFGCFSFEKKLKTDYEKLYLKGVKAKPIHIDKNSILEEDLFNRPTPIIFTGHELKMYYSRDKSYGFFVGRSDSFDDLVSFWNFRAMNIDALFLPIDKIDRFGKLISVIKNDLDAAKKGTKSTWQFDYCMYYSRINETSAKEIKSKYFSGYELFSSIYDNIYKARQCVYHFKEQPVQFNIEEDSEGHFVMNAQLPSFKYIEDNKYFPREYFAAYFEFLSEYEYPQHTLQLFNFYDMNEWCAREIYFHFNRLRIGSNGFSIIIDDDNFMTLRPIHLPKYLTKLLERAKINAIPSEAGKIANQIITQMGDIEGCRVFKITGVRSLLRTMNPLSKKTKNECCEIIADRKTDSFKKFNNLYIESLLSKLAKTK